MHHIKTSISILGYGAIMLGTLEVHVALVYRTTFCEAWKATAAAFKGPSGPGLSISALVSEADD